MKWNRGFWGIVFILGAAYLIVTRVFNITVDIALWRVLVGIVLLYVLVESARGRYIFGILVPLAGLYWLFAPYFDIFEPPLVPFIGAVILLCIGFYILFGRKHRLLPRSNPKHGSKDGCKEIGTDEKMDIDGDVVFRQVNLGSSEIRLLSKNLKEGKFTCSLGDMHVYCTDAALCPDGASIVLECNMGSLSLYVPKTWQVKQDIAVVMGNVEEHNRYGEGQGPLLSVTGNVKMGSIEIIYL